MLHYTDRNAYRMCERKKRFAGRRAAGQAAQRATERTGKAHRAYQCPHCTGWHITSHEKAADRQHPIDGNRA